MNEAVEQIPLGKTGLMVSPLGTGAWAWGDRLVWGFGAQYQSEDIQEAFHASLQGGVNFFDTAEVYGQGQSERFLGSFLPAASVETFVATKFMPYPWRLRRQSLLSALRGSLERLGVKQVDLYQIHWPFPPLSPETWAMSLSEAVEQGLTRSVGVSNYSEEQMRRAASVLTERGIPLASNQVEYSLLNRKVENNGVLKACQDMGVTLIAYSPLAQGLLSGKYTPQNPPSGVRGRRYNRIYLEKIAPLIQLLRTIGWNHEGKSPSQVALNWLICKGTLPIPGAKNARQAQENTGALGWRLSDDEISQLDEASQDL